MFALIFGAISYVQVVGADELRERDVAVAPVRGRRAVRGLLGHAVPLVPQLGCRVVLD